MRQTTILFFWLFVAVLGTAGQKETDSLPKRFTTTQQDTNQVYLLVELATQYKETKPDSALLLSQQALDLARKLKFEKGEERSLTALGGAYMWSGNSIKAVQLFQQALKLSTQLNDSKGRILALNGYAWSYFLQDDLRKELSVHLQIEQEARKANDSEALERALSNAGKTYTMLRVLDSANSYLQQAYSINQKRQNNYESKASLLNRIGVLKVFEGKMDSALTYFHQSKHGYEALQSNSRLAEAYYGLAKTYQLMGRKDSAFYYGQRAVSAAEKSAFPPLTIVRPLGLLAELYESTGDYKEALRYNRLSVASKDSLQSRNKMNQLAALMFDERLQKQEMEAKKQQYQSRIRTYVLLFALFVFLSVAFFLYRTNRQKQEANALLQVKNTEIDKQRAKAERTLQELKATQAQLVQREKMASLGELTAGIAHEIQNPLNFVNNFSEVSAEMIQDLETAAGNKDETLSLASDLKANLQKIHHHGKRAESVVKNMMEHSRNASGKKQLTDINGLAEEYLRLAYHGVQLRDKSFNAVIETHFDPAVGKLNLVPQDIGRVLLNLFNNAFYAVNEKKKQLNGSSYQPEVSVSTKKASGKIEISVRDNGTGIPEKLVDKIFQPFFTTKPTGEGTGLGLSLCYDIVTKGHTGEIRVVSKEGEGADFTIQFPS